jgi:hypothetical protein
MLIHITKEKSLKAENNWMLYLKAAELLLLYINLTGFYYKQAT